MASIPIPCSVDGCNNPRSSRGLCPMHYMRVIKAEKLAQRVPCSVLDCHRLAYTRDLCATHYGRWRISGSTDRLSKVVRPRGTPDAVWFWEMVEKTDGCWFWKGALTKQGYGKFTAVDSGMPKTVVAHRFAYELLNGPFPEDKPCGCHNCDVNYPVGDSTYRRCCRPDHIFPGTHQDNRADCVAKGRQAVGDRNGTHTRPETVRRGSRHGMATITEGDVRVIRALYGQVSSRELANRFGNSMSTIQRIVKRTAWAHVK